MSKHTPGPWKVEPMGKQLYIETEYKSALTPFVCDMQFPDCQSDEERETAQANATLIAAAPELLEELKETLTYHPGVTHGRCGFCGHYGDDCRANRIKALINKAEGREG